jgi:hypothetical protein
MLGDPVVRCFDTGFWGESPECMIGQLTIVKSNGEIELTICFSVKYVSLLHNIFNHSCTFHLFVLKPNCCGAMLIYFDVFLKRTVKGPRARYSLSSNEKFDKNTKEKAPLTY